MTTTESDDLIDVIIADHRAFDDAFRELETGEGTPEHRKQLVDHVMTELVRHAVAEEQFLYPAARQHLENGDEVVDHEIEEHDRAEQAMKDLEDVSPTDDGFEARVRKLIDEVRHHLEDEEDDLLPRLRRACTAEELRELGSKVKAAKKVAPTRPHPTAPNTPPANLVVQPGLGLIDRARDKLSST